MLKTTLTMHYFNITTKKNPPKFDGLGRIVKLLFIW